MYRLARRLDTLTLRFLDSRHGAFFDTCDRMLRTWKFGSMFGYWRQWHEWAKETAMARAISSGDKTSVELRKQFDSSNAECARLRNQVRDCVSVGLLYRCVLLHSLIAWSLCIAV